MIYHSYELRRFTSRFNSGVQCWALSRSCWRTNAWSRTHENLFQLWNKQRTRLPRSFRWPNWGTTTRHSTRSTKTIHEIWHYQFIGTATAKNVCPDPKNFIAVIHRMSHSCAKFWCNKPFVQNIFHDNWWIAICISVIFSHKKYLWIVINAPEPSISDVQVIWRCWKSRAGI